MNMNCETFQEWMSLAQDGMLNSVESRLLHEHLSTCSSCQAQWEAMMSISQMFHAVPMVMPAPGFVLRFQARLAYREEQRRRAMAVLLLGVGVIALFILALPSLLGFLGLTGRLLLPYWMVVYLQGTWQWICMALNSLSEAAWLILRSFAATSRGMSCIGLVAVTVVLLVLWVPLMMRRMSTRVAR